MSFEIILPWPSKELSPNGRFHWAQKSRAAKKAREVGFFTAREAGLGSSTFADYPGKIHMWITFFPKTCRMPDDDNCLASFKPYRDGIADALGIDDRRFVSHPIVDCCPVKGGAVMVKLSAGPQQ